MDASKNSWLQAPRHPLPCLLFLLPLLAAYEVGVLWLGGRQADALRNGADAWLRWAFQHFGLTALYGPPLLIIAVFLAWSWRRRGDRPDDLMGVWLLMAIESVIFALLLWGLSRAQTPILERLGDLGDLGDRLGDRLGTLLSIREDLAFSVSFVGAGIYEELLFRLLLFPFIVWLLRWIDVPELPAIALAVLLSALLFAAAHHVGPGSEPFHAQVFFFRLLAGVFFALLFQLRGFGIAVGTHACYDILVGVALA